MKEADKDFTEKLKDIKTTVQPKLKDAYNKAKPKVEKAYNKAKPRVEEAYRKAKPKVEEAYKKARPKVEEAYNKAKPQIIKTYNTVKTKAEPYAKKAEIKIKEKAPGIVSGVATFCGCLAGKVAKHSKVYCDEFKKNFTEKFEQERKKD
jgi:vacuolar-type H+-ATPase subunit H